MEELARAGRHPRALRLLSSLYTVQDARLTVRRFGLTFPNPVGLAAGFDKNALAVPTWPALGFGFTEVGSVTAQAQPGNPKPRLFRLPEDEALINRLGFNNSGAAAVAARLATPRRETIPTPLGVNLGKSKVTPLDDAPSDYLASLEKLWPYADYFVVNVSSPNTPGLRELQEGERLERLLDTVTGYAAGQRVRKPILLKIAPDLSFEQLDEIVRLALEFNLSGLIATNTTVARAGLRTPIDETGGLSGRPLGGRSLELLRYLRAQVGDALPLVSVGGIFNADDVWERLRAGASLVQLYTSFVYRGPGLVKEINKGLLARLDGSGAGGLEAIIGRDA